MKTFKEFIAESKSAAQMFSDRNQIGHHARAFHRPSTESDMKNYHKKELIRLAGKQRFKEIQQMSFSDVCKI
jgi:hypothetical protein